MLFNRVPQVAQNQFCDTTIGLNQKRVPGTRFWLIGQLFILDLAFDHLLIADLDGNAFWFDFLGFG